MHPAAGSMLKLFQGHMSAYGSYRIEKHDSNFQGKKVEGRGHTVREDVTEKIWSDHLEGISGIGITPINPEGESSFGAIDIDDYSLDLKKLNIRIHEAKLPLILCRSKSGGAHLFLFAKFMMPVKELRERLSALSAFLGFGMTEIFPKQVELLSSRGDVGNWINMPYFDEAQTLRYAFGADNKRLSLNNFISNAGLNSVSVEGFNTYKVPVKNNQFPDGPPCLQRLDDIGFPEGTRNNGLYNTGVYAKKAHPDEWDKMVEGYNRGLEVPLSGTEVGNIIKSLKNKDYNYKCSEEPICRFCDAALCRTRKFGISGGHSTPEISNLSKLDSIPPLWFIDVGGKRMMISTDALMNFRMFQRACLESFNTIPFLQKNEKWDMRVQSMLENITIIDGIQDAGEEEMVEVIFLDWLLNSPEGKTPEDLLLGKVMTTKKYSHDYSKRHYFQLKSFKRVLGRNNLHSYPHNKLVNLFREKKGGKKFFNIRGVGFNTFWVPFNKKETTPLPVPEIPDLKDII